jgi:hypothetical protein
VLILLPPSEGKAPGGAGDPVDLAALSWPELTAARKKVATALVAICRRSPKKARDLLGLSEALDDDRVANTELDASPTMSAGHRYCGVLHDAFGYPTLTSAVRRRADDSVVVFSGLWGAVRPTDQLPAYRIGINTNLPRIGPLPTYWRGPLLKALDEEIADLGALDLRSSGYTHMVRPSSGLHPIAITAPDGVKSASSYQSKVAKGRLVRELVRTGTPSLDRLASAASAIGLSATDGPKGLTVRVPNGWGLVNPPRDR